jgi:3-hydroxyacyl-CoA dehydrogenase / enoyl-CoA hydratase / 3-hydroxybutyryl-CoA epimerase / enoyl-CoA isomerase
MSYKNFNVKNHNGFVEVNIDCENSSGNAFNRAVMDELNLILDSLDENVKGLIFTSAKSTFVVGADVNEILSCADDEAKLIDFVRCGHKTFNRIEDLPFVTIALINGTAMGGGLEITLACDYRIVADDDSIQLALPETKLGILPAWGGTTRLPRLIGADNAIDAICSAKSYRPRQALKMGLVDGIVHQEVLRAEEFLHFKLDDDVQKKRAKKAGPLKINFIESMMVFKGARGLVSKAAGPHYPAPLKVLDIIEQGKKFSRDDALELEVNAAVELGQLPVTANLIGIFLKDQAVKVKNRELSKGVDVPKTASVIGGGTMGGDIAYLTANKGMPTHLHDMKAGIAVAAKNRSKSYLMDKVKKNYISVDDMTDVLDNFNVGNEWPKDIAIEAIYENFDAKVSAIKALEDAEVVVSNTSTISITKLAEATEREVCGMHFFNPVKKMPLVEVIRGKNTSDETVAKVVGLAMKLGKTPVVVNDCAGFLVNRLLFPYLMAFDEIVKEGWDFESIDKCMKDWGWPMGPATLCDLVGMDIAYNGGKIMAEAYGWKLNDDGPIATLNASGDLGQKTGSGFYEWKEKRGKMVSSGTNYAKGKDIKDRFGCILSSLMIPMCKEAEKILEEGIVDSWDEIDLAMIMGAGFPPFRGGLSKFK